MTTRCRFRPRTAGFTLIEIMVVITILGLLATLVVPNLVNNVEESKSTKTRTDTVAIAQAAKLFFVRRGRLPTLDDLTARDGDNPPALEHLPRDPWDHDYVLRQGRTRDEFEVLSAGPDGQLDTEDDISSRPSK